MSEIAWNPSQSLTDIQAAYHRQESSQPTEQVALTAVEQPSSLLRFAPEDAQNLLGRRRSVEHQARTELADNSPALNTELIRALEEDKVHVTHLI